MGADNKASLSDKLKSLGVKVGARDLPPPNPRHVAYAIERVLPGGRFEATPYGQIFVVETRYSPEYRHGRAGLHLSASRQMVAEWARDGRIAACAPAALTFLDTETTGLAGGTGTYAFLIGVGRYEGDHFHLAQFFMREPPEEPAQLAALVQFLQPCETVVTFNGKGFDLPLLNARYTINGAASPFSSLAHLDLLPLARRLWRDRLPSRALGQLEVHILQANRTGEDVPGWLIPSLYFDYLRSGDARPLKGIFYHNALDILAMAALLNHITHLLEDPLDGRVEHSLDLVALAKFFEVMGNAKQAIQLYQHSLVQELPEEGYWEALYRLSFIQKRQENWPAAVALWEQAAESRQIYAYVELAKFYEHRARDYDEAGRWTEAALSLIDAPHCPQAKRRQWLAALRHRLARLQRKMDRG